MHFDFISLENFFIKKLDDEGVDEIIGGTTVARGQHQYMVSTIYLIAVKL
jgi:hypothetical protein